jgi:hypothetical protein
MMRFRIVLAAVVASLAIGVVGVPAAGAASSTSAAPMYKTHINGVAKNGKKFSGTYSIQRFVGKGADAYAVGTLKGKMKGRRVSRSNVMMPASLQGGNGPGNSPVFPPPQGGNCTILHLVLGPIDLNLLGLEVKLGGGPNANQVIVLDITAHQGEGLLGDLLCAVSNLLNSGPGLTQLRGQQLAAALNSVVAMAGAQ